MQAAGYTKLNKTQSLSSQSFPPNLPEFAWTGINMARKVSLFRKHLEICMQSVSGNLAMERAHFCSPQRDDLLLNTCVSLFLVAIIHDFCAFLIVSFLVVACCFCSWLPGISKSYSGTYSLLVSAHSLSILRWLAQVLLPFPKQLYPHFQHCYIHHAVTFILPGPIWK